MDTERLFKVLHEDGSCYHGSDGIWPLPTKNGPGDWRPPIEGPLVGRGNGYELYRIGDLLDRLGPVIFEAEHRGELLWREDDFGVVIAREARLIRQLNWDGRSARLFACDYAEATLSIFEGFYPHPAQVRTLIDVTRQQAVELAGVEELATAWAAVWKWPHHAPWVVASHMAWDAATNAANAAAVRSDNVDYEAARKASRAAIRNEQAGRLIECFDRREPAINTDGGIKLDQLAAREPWLLAGLCGVALVVLGISAILDRGWR